MAEVSYRRPSTYSYPPKFTKLEDVENYTKRLYAELLENDSRGEEITARATDKDLREMIVRPEWYGAKRDGITDDTASIQAAIDSLPDGGIVQLSSGTYLVNSLITISDQKIILRGSGFSTVIHSASTTGGIKVTANWAGLEDLYLSYTGSGAYGIKVSNAYGVVTKGHRFSNVKISGGAGTSHGLWLVYCTHSYFNVILPNGGGDAIRLESSAFNTFDNPRISVNMEDTGVRWTNGITLQKIDDVVYLQSDDNLFTEMVVEGVSGAGVLLTSTFGTSGESPARNTFIGGTSEGNTGHDIFIENGMNNQFIGVHNETSTVDIEIAGNFGNHGNSFYGCQAWIVIRDPGVPQGIQSTQIYNHVGGIEIFGTNVFGTVIIGGKSWILGSGTEPFIIQSTCYQAPDGPPPTTAVTMFRVPSIGVNTSQVAEADGLFEVQFPVEELGFDSAIKLRTSSAPGSGDGSGIAMRNSGVETAGVFGITQELGYGGALVFYTHTSAENNTFGTTFTEKMRIDKDGEVDVKSGNVNIPYGHTYKINNIGVVDQGVTTADSPTFNTVNLSSLADGSIPYNTGSGELILNGGFNSNADNWTGVDCTLASVAGGQSGNCLEITRTAFTQQVAYQAVSGMTVGLSYVFSAWVKSGTSGDEAFRILAEPSGGINPSLIDGASSGTWTQYTITFVALQTSYTFALYKNTATPGTMLFDTVSLPRIPNLEDSPLSADGTNVNNSGVYKKGGIQVVGAQGAAVADATDAPSVILRLNDLLARCRAHGIIAT